MDIIDFIGVYESCDPGICLSVGLPTRISLSLSINDIIGKTPKGETLFVVTYSPERQEYPFENMTVSIEYINNHYRMFIIVNDYSVLYIKQETYNGTI